MIGTPGILEKGHSWDLRGPGGGRQMRTMDTMERVRTCRHPDLGKDHDGDSASWRRMTAEDPRHPSRP